MKEFDFEKLVYPPACHFPDRSGYNSKIPEFHKPRKIFFTMFHNLDIEPYKRMQSQALCRASTRTRVSLTVCPKLYSYNPHAPTAFTIEVLWITRTRILEERARTTMSIQVFALLCVSICRARIQIAPERVAYVLLVRIVQDVVCLCLDHATVSDSDLFLVEGFVSQLVVS